MENETLRTHQNFRENESGLKIIKTMDDRNVPRSDQEAVVALLQRTLLPHATLVSPEDKVEDCSLDYSSHYKPSFKL